MADETSSDNHKRSKSVIAKSLLGRGNAKSSLSHDGEEGTEDLSTSGTSPSLMSSPNVPPKKDADSKQSTQEPQSAKAFPPTTTFSVGDTHASIEQSVKKFKVFEVLRNGDKEAIERVLADISAGKNTLEETTILHLAIQCAEPPVVEYVLSSEPKLDINAQDRDGNTPLHFAAMLGRVTLARLLLDQKTADSSILNYQGKSALDTAKTPEVFQLLQLDRALFIDTQVKRIQQLVRDGDYNTLESVLEDSRVTAVIDVNGAELASESATVESGGSLLHEASRKKDMKLIQLLLLNGADPFRRDRRGKLPQDVTKDDKTRAILKKSPAATAAQRGIQEKAILGSNTADKTPGGKESREIKGYLKKWTNYTSGYKLRWFVLEDGVLSYYKHQDDAGSACRGAMNMRIAKLSMDAQDNTRFEIQGKSSVKYHLKANHSVEAKRWFWALNNAIQFSKDEAKAEQRRQAENAENTRLALSEHKSRGGASLDIEGRTLTAAASSLGITSNNGSSLSFRPGPKGASVIGDEQGSVAGSTYEPSVGNDFVRVTSKGQTATNLPDDDGDYGDNDASSREMQPAPKDAFNITAHSANLQLDLLAQVSNALQAQATSHSETSLSSTEVVQAIATYDEAVHSLKSMVGNLLKISRDRDAYWQYRLDREVDLRRLWEESMAKVAQEQELLESRIDESEERRKLTKKALKEVLEEQKMSTSAVEPAMEGTDDAAQANAANPRVFRRGTLAALSDIDDSESDDEEFFDAVGAGEVPVHSMLGSSQVTHAKDESVPTLDVHPQSSGKDSKATGVETSFAGYEDPVRKRLKMDADDRPKISLWGILKSMIGKDMTKMTLPVSFNEPTSLLQRVAEDMEYTDLLDTASDRSDSTERMVYVAAFAASEYASTIGRVAKPFNPLLAETYEYVRPDKGYRFLIEQVSHHPPIGAAWAESARWDYYGESAVKSKFYGKSFDINPLGTWFLKLRPASGGEELYTWKKVTSSVIGIITGNPTVDNYGPMEIKNWTTGEVCMLDFQARGWKASSAFKVSGKVLDAAGKPRWSLGGRWNDKIYARSTPGFEATVDSPKDQAFLVWQAHTRPTGIPFNLTPFVLTLNAVPDSLRKVLPRTDTRLRPDQRAMEDGEYDLAATEKDRVEVKQRVKRREREEKGEEFEPRWFRKSEHPVTKEPYWESKGEYWKVREKVGSGEGDWDNVEEIF